LTQLRKIHLYGSLAEKFGAEAIELTANTAPDLMLALRSIFPEWRSFLQEFPDLVFVLSGDDKATPRGIESEFIESQFGDATEVHIIPAQDGAGIEIAALMGITNVFAAFVVNTIASMLISMALGAVMQALAPSPQTGAGSKNQVAEAQSFLFNGAINVEQQGGPVPIIYGYFMSGSTVVSAAVDVEQLLTTPAQSVPPANGGGSAQPASPPATAWQWAGQ
jgi:predicted phage tail protein